MLNIIQIWQRVFEKENFKDFVMVAMKTKVLDEFP